MSEMNILVVEDEQTIRKGIEKAITQLNDEFRVLSTEDDGETALQWLEKAEILPDLIITDIYMQFMDGIELIEQVNSRYPGITCAILSGHEDFRLAQKAIDLKVCRYITKPVQPAELHGILSTIREDIMKARLRYASQHAGKPSSVNTESYVREKLISAVTKTSVTSDIVDKVAAYIEQHYYDYSLTLQSLADVVSLHPNYLTQMFRKQTGLSCMQYLAKTRIEKAKQLLNNTDLKIAEIARKVGYENPLYFSSYFKKWVGKNPSDYKEESGSYA